MQSTAYLGNVLLGYVMTVLLISKQLHLCTKNVAYNVVLVIAEIFASVTCFLPILFLKDLIKSDLYLLTALAIIAAVNKLFS